MENLELTSLNCTNCGASASNYEGKSLIVCEYCNTEIKVLRPKSVNISKENLSKENFDKLSNYVEILQKAIRAGNFNEGYEYCNKALEINPNIGSIWENKAICAFWRSVSFLNEDKITNSNAREIRTFLNASKENDPQSDTYAITADAIGSNLYTVLKLKLKSIQPDTTIKIGNKAFPAYSDKWINRSKDLLETMQTAYNLMVNKDLNILKYLAKEYTNNGLFMWWQPTKKFGTIVHPANTKPSEWALKSGMNIELKLNGIIKQIQQAEPRYNSPKVNIQVTPSWVIILSVGVFLLVYIMGSN